MTPEGQRTNLRLIQRIIHPFKQGREGTTRRESHPIRTTTPQNSVQGTERQLHNVRAEHRTKTAHEAYIEYLTRSGKPIPQIAGQSYEDLTPADREYINRTYAEYEVQRYIQEYNSTEERRQGEPKSYWDYLIQSGKTIIPMYAGKVLNSSEREYITQTYKEYLTKKYKYKEDMPALGVEHLIQLELNLNTSPPIVVDGKIMSGLEYWNYLQEKRQREKQAKVARGELPDTSHPAPLVAQQLNFDQTTPVTPNQRRERNLSIFSALRGQFVTELKHADIDLIAEDIRSNMWGYAGSMTKIRPAEEGKITIKDNGTVINRFRSGLRLSYPLLDENRKPKAQADRATELSMGIGYFGDEDKIYITREAQGTVSEEDLKKGIKAYFIRRTFFDEATMKKKTYMTIIPFAYADAQRTFYEHLADSAIYLDPRKFVPRRQMRRYVKSRQSASQPKQQAA